MKTVAFCTLGCKVNQYETQLIREQFLAKGFQEVPAAADADMYVINTCTVTARADKESLYLIHRSRRINPKAGIMVTGCMAEKDAALIKRQPGVTKVLRNRDKQRIFGGRACRGISDFAGHSRAFVKIQDGCNNRCSYCKVCLVRGASRSRPMADILVESRSLAAKGFREIVLTGICLGSFGKDLAPAASLTDLLAELENIAGLERIRLSSIEASDITPRLIRMIAVSRKLCRHLHMPIQSGDDVILRKMNRRYTAAEYERLVTRIKKAVPGIAITTDVLVGFPGENEANFRNTLKLLRRIKPSRMHIFGYSPRQGTPAVAMPGQVSREEIKARMHMLRQEGEKFTAAFIRQAARKPQRVIFESPVPGKPGWWEGYTDTYVKVRVRQPGLSGRVVVLRLTESAFSGNITPL